VISPLLANIYLHEVLDEWFAGLLARSSRGCEVAQIWADMRTIS
jgi:hypothetical protein